MPSKSYCNYHYLSRLELYRGKFMFLIWKLATKHYTTARGGYAVLQKKQGRATEYQKGNFASNEAQGEAL
jgi:hypothetical protein